MHGVQSLLRFLFFIFFGSIVEKVLMHVVFVLIILLVIFMLLCEKSVYQKFLKKLNLKNIIILISASSPNFDITKKKTIKKIRKRRKLHHMNAANQKYA